MSARIIVHPHLSRCVAFGEVIRDLQARGYVLSRRDRGGYVAHAVPVLSNVVHLRRNPAQRSQ